MSSFARVEVYCSLAISCHLGFPVSVYDGNQKHNSRADLDKRVTLKASDNYFMKIIVKFLGFLDF